MRLLPFIIAAAIPMGTLAQTEIYVPYKNKNLWTAETLYVGASFIYQGGAGGGGGGPWWKVKFGALQPITVTLKGNEAGWQGSLFAIVQDSKGIEHKAFLFKNWDPPGTSLNLRDLYGFTIPAGAEITFEYDVTDPPGSAPCWGCWPVAASDAEPKYSGPNRGRDLHRSKATSEDMPNPNWRYGHRWSVVGRNPAGDLEFGFEDCTQSFSDMDFDDVVFTVSNLEIGVFNRRLVTRDLVR